jgi:chemotaxis family two-component system response regulator Rcp1
MHILLAEDNPQDIFFVHHALQHVAKPVELSVVQDGQLALHFLFRIAPYAHVTRPDLVLLDLNMPRKTGIDVLTELGHDPQLKCIPVIMFTSSTLQHDINRCYELGANAYIAKPAGIAQLTTILTGILDFWGLCEFHKRLEGK